MLLVEEEEAVLEFERDVLMGAGAAVVTAKTSEDVKTRLLSEQFDAIIMNGKMPDQWGAKNPIHGSRKTASGWKDTFSTRSRTAWSLAMGAHSCRKTMFPTS